MKIQNMEVLGRPRHNENQIYDAMIHQCQRFMNVNCCLWNHSIKQLRNYMSFPVELDISRKGFSEFAKSLNVPFNAVAYLTNEDLKNVQINKLIPDLVLISDKRKIVIEFNDEYHNQTNAFGRSTYDTAYVVLRQYAKKLLALQEGYEFVIIDTSNKSTKEVISVLESLL